MGLFQQIEGDNAILIERGVFKQADLYSRDGYLFAKASGGFIRLMADGSTSKSSARLEELSIEADLYKDPVGRLCVSDKVRGAKMISGTPAAAKLLGLPAPE